MDKGLLDFLALLAGLLAGLAIRRRWRPLLAERWRGLVLIPPALLISALPFIIWQLRPEWIWSADRSLLISLVLLRTLIWTLLLVLNLLPSAWFAGRGNQGLTLTQKLFLLPVLAGLAGEAAVLWLNNGYWPIPESILTQSANPAFAAGVRNEAYLFLRIIDESTRLPWLSQIWAVPHFSQWHLATLPTISPAEVMTALGLFGIGISQFFAPIIEAKRSCRQRSLRKLRKTKIRAIHLKDK